MEKLTVVEKPFGHLPLLQRLRIYAQAIFGMIFYVGLSWVYRHRMGVLVPLASKVRPPSPLPPSLLSR